MTGPLPTVPGLTGLSVLARGGYATVYRAVQESVGREVAVKVENRTLQSERDRRRFLREARASGSMSSHPHVVDLFDAGVGVGGHPYLIMELCDGSYADRIKVSPLSPVEARDVGVKIADALADAHSLGVLHRDVKPANILFTRFGEPALADFGLAILAETRDMSITLDVLTPAYAPPEMFRHAPPAPSGDVYALSATLYALMRGAPPRWREGSSPNLVSLVDMFSEPVPDIDGVPAGLLDLLRIGMSNDPDARPTAAELRDALLALRLETPVAAGPAQGPVLLADLPGADDITVAHPRSVAGPDRRIGDDRAEPWEPAGSGSGRPADGRRRRRWLWWAAAGAAEAAIILASVAVWSITGLPGTDPTTPSSPATSAVAGASTGATATAACPPVVPGNVRCPPTPECYDRLRVTDGLAQTRRLDCAARHTWEVFALAELPPDAAGADYAKVTGNPRVREVCNIAILAMVSGFGVVEWQTDVLPPTAEAVNAGDRTFRCLAGKGDNALVGPQLRRPATRPS